MGRKVTTYKDSMDYAGHIINYIYVLLMFTIYILVLHNRYFDITRTKYACFMCITLLYIASLGFLRVLAFWVDKNDTGAQKVSADKRIKCKNIPACMMLLFMTANLCSCIIGDEYALYGEMGRFMGFITYTVIGLAFILLSCGYKGHESLYVVFGTVIIFTLIIAIVQHTGYDVFGLKENIQPKQYKKFISTFGNINIFASYLVMITGVSVGAFMYAGKAVRKSFSGCLRILYGVILFLIGMTVMTANSDSVYMGMGVIMLTAFVIAYRNDELKIFACAAFWLSVGYLVMAYCHTRMKKVPSYGGLTRKLDNIKLAFSLTVAIALFYGLLVLVARIKKKTGRPGINKNIGTVVIFAATVCAIAVFVVKGISSGDSLFKFDYKWGTYRGYIWTKSVETYQEAPLLNKVFGYGNESIRQVITVPNFEEMKAATNRIYDNAHNELLQYLVTLGLFGVVSYLLLIIGSVWYILKYGRRDMHSYIPVFASVGYFAQALVNINQPITTPLYFMLLAMGVGYAAYCRKDEGV